LSLSFGLGLALSSASCGPTCPHGQQSCGSSNSSGGAEAADPAKCELLTAMQSCMTAYCKTASNPFCGCYNQGKFLTTNGCTCVEFNAKKFCADAEDSAVGASSYDCAADSSAVSSFCVPVQ
jgi:hypothetical protein